MRRSENIYRKIETFQAMLWFSMLTYSLQGQNGEILNIFLCAKKLRQITAVFLFAGNIKRCPTPF